MNTNQNIDTYGAKELELLDQAITAFQRETGYTTKKGRGQLQIGRRIVDATIRIEEPGGPIEYFAEIKTRVTDTLLGRLIQQFNETPGKWIVVAHFVPIALAKKMKGLGIQFMDTAGNTYIDEPPLMIFMCGNRPEKKLVARKEGERLGVGGIRVLFALLCQPQLENATYREIAKAADTALGTVAGVVKDLTQYGFLLDLGRGRRKLTRKNELVEKWTRAYAEKFRHRLLIGRFTAFRTDFWQDIRIDDRNALWGGEVAANKLTRYLKPAITTLYTRRPIDKLVLELKLRKDENGPVELREQFWGFETIDPVMNTVPALLVYADLLATAETRNIETAKLVYDQYSKRHFE